MPGTHSVLGSRWWKRQTQIHYLIELLNVKVSQNEKANKWTCNLTLDVISRMEYPTGEKVPGRWWGMKKMLFKLGWTKCNILAKVARRWLMRRGPWAWKVMACLTKKKDARKTGSSEWREAEGGGGKERNQLTSGFLAWPGFGILASVVGHCRLWAAEVMTQSDLPF